MRGLSAIERIWRRVIKIDDPKACWEWPGAMGSDGYGHIRDGMKVRQVHRVVYEHANHVQLTSADHVRHTCDNPMCCRPSHLEVGTRQENIDDMVAKDRHRTPRPGNGIAKIKPDQYPVVARLVDETGNKSAVGRMFNITPTRVRQIWNFVNGTQ